MASQDYKPKEVTLSEEEKKLFDKWLVKANYETSHEDMTSDVVVIGGGGAGLAAAISASENGAKVIVLVLDFMISFHKVLEVCGRELIQMKIRWAQVL